MRGRHRRGRVSTRFTWFTCTPARPVDHGRSARCVHLLPSRLSADADETVHRHGRGRASVFYRRGVTIRRGRRCRAGSSSTRSRVYAVYLVHPHACKASRLRSLSSLFTSLTSWCGGIARLLRARVHHQPTPSRSLRVTIDEVESRRGSPRLSVIRSLATKYVFIVAITRNGSSVS